jgi:hypothetical protein
MKKIQLIMAMALLITQSGCHRDPSQNKIVGDWIEFRREERSGYVYTIGGVLNEPSLELSFNKNGQGTFFNPRLPEPKVELEYKIVGDSILEFGKPYEIIKAEKDTLILIRRNINSEKSIRDAKLFFLKKEKYDQLSESKKKELAGPKAKDNAYLERILERKKRQAE